MYAVIDADGRVLTTGGTDSFVAPEGGQIIETDTDPLAGLAAGEEAYWDGAAFGKRARAISAEEQARRDDLATIKAFMQAANGSATNAQRDAVFKAFVRVARDKWQELRD